MNFAYDSWNRIQSMTYPDGEKVSYGYNLGGMLSSIGCLNALCKSINIYADFNKDEKECYWYHPDHLGSSSWITYTNGEAIQHLHYLPFGENFVDQCVTGYEGARYTFSAKEKDEETGYGYFGSRYYSSELSIWLSVDPMADKYPSMSPYTYCANNPIKLVDPNGEEVILVGDQIDEAFSSLQSGTNLQLSIDKDGRITASGTVLNENDEQLLKAITSTDVTCEINTGGQFRAGEYNGTKYDAQSKTAISTNNVNIYSMQNLEESGASGSGIIHEITEGYNLGRYVVDTRKSTIPENASEGHMEKIIVGAGQYAKEYEVFVPNNTPLHNIYEQEGHLKATKAPNEMTRKEAKSYKTATF